MPKRIQRKRTKGWRMPPNTRYVGRPTRFGNPFRVGEKASPQQCVDMYERYVDGEVSRGDMEWRNTLYDDPNFDGRRYSPYTGKMLIWAGWLETLRGKDLTCWCALDCVCHADVLLEIANA